MSSTTAPLEPNDEDAPSTLRKTARVMPAMMRRELRARSQTTPFLIWISFLLSLIGARAWVHFFKSVGRGDTSSISFEVGRNVILGGYHIHHIATGIVLLAIAGWMTLHYRGRQIARVAAIMYGVGLGFIVDEMGFVIGGITPYRNDDEVFYVAIILGALLMSAVFAPRFWKALRGDLRSLGRVIRGLPALQRPIKENPPLEVDRELEAALGPPKVLSDPDAADGAPVGATAPPVEAPTASLITATDRSRMVPEAMGTHPAPPSAAAPAGHPASTADHVKDPALGDDYRASQSARTQVFESLLGKVMEILIVIILVGLLLGIAKLVLSLGDVLLGFSVARLMQPILIGVLTLLIGAQLLRAMVEYLRHQRLMLPFLVDAGILLGLREIADELFKASPNALLVGVIGGVLVALGGLRVILVRSMVGMQAREPAEPKP